MSQNTPTNTDVLDPKVVPRASADNSLPDTNCASWRKLTTVQRNGRIEDSSGLYDGGGSSQRSTGALLLAFLERLDVATNR
jgi:hypothetical protein